MTTREFITKWTGERVDRWDPANLNQCVDLVLQFVDEVMAMPALIPLGINPAYDLYNKVHKLSPHVNKIANTLTAIPQAGDIVVWSNKYGPQGHTAICTGWAGQEQFEAFSQNDPIGSPCVIKRYTYTHVLGWLRPNTLPVEEPTMTDQQKKDHESMNNLRTYNNVWYESKNIIGDYKTRLMEIRGLQDELGAKSREITSLKKAVEVAQNLGEQQLAQAKIDCDKKVADLTDKNRIDMENIETRYKEEIKKLKEEGDTVQVPTETPLNFRFRDKTINQKLLAILEIMGA